MDGESLKSINIPGKSRLPSSKDLSNQRTLKRSFTLSDLPNAHSISNPFKIAKPETEIAVSTGLVSKTGIRLKRSNSFNPFSLKNSQSKSRLSIDNPFNILKGQEESIDEPPKSTNLSSALENPIISKRKRLCLEKENIPPEVLEDIKKDESILKTSTVEEPDSDGESEKSLDEDGPLDFITSSSNTLSKKGALKSKQFYMERDSLPIDWSLKKSFTITSNFSLDWIPSLMNNRNAKSSIADSDSNSFDQTRLLFWSAFESPMPPSHSSIVSRLLAREMKYLHAESNKSSNRQAGKIPIMNDAEKAEYNFFKDREDQWKKSFQNAYRKVKTGELKYLCYENSLFLMTFVNLDNQGMKGYMSRSTPGFRLVLKEQEIEYDLLDGNGVFLESPADVAEDHENLEGFEDLIKKRDNSETKKPPNALFFKNAKCCHAIFDFLLNWTDPKVEIRAQGPPKLASSGPFLGASLSQCIPSKPMFVIQGDKPNKTEMRMKSSNSKTIDNQDEPTGLWSATIKNGNAGLCPLMIRDFVMHAASIFDQQAIAQEKLEKGDYELKIIFENDSDVASFKGGNVYDGTLMVKSLVYSKGKFQLNAL